MYTPETKAKRMDAAKAKVADYNARAARFERLRGDALATAATWQTQWEWLNGMPTSAPAPTEETP